MRSIPGLTRHPAMPRRLGVLCLLFLLPLLAACSDETAQFTDDDAPWTIEQAESVGFVKVEELKPGPAKVVEAWVGHFNHARVELYRHGLTELGLESPVDPTWLHDRIRADNCCNFWQRNRLTAICVLEEQACQGLRDALEAEFPQ